MLEEILTRLMSVICDSRHYSIRVMYDKYQVEREHLLNELIDSHTEREIYNIKKGIENYDFLTIIKLFHEDYNELY